MHEETNEGYKTFWPTDNKQHGVKTSEEVISEGADCCGKVNTSHKEFCIAVF